RHVPLYLLVAHYNFRSGPFDSRVQVKSRDRASKGREVNSWYQGFCISSFLIVGAAKLALPPQGQDRKLDLMGLWPSQNGPRCRSGAEGLSVSARHRGVPINAWGSRLAVRDECTAFGCLSILS